MMFAVMQPLQPQVQAGKLRAIAVTTAKRFRLLPDLPAIAESGYPGSKRSRGTAFWCPPARQSPSSRNSTPRSTDPEAA
jgi:tripartite-type tricarboxylate transporter receptor subunit TctC